MVQSKARATMYYPSGMGGRKLHDPQRIVHVVSVGGFAPSKV